MNGKRLYKSRDNRMISGVCAVITTPSCESNSAACMSAILQRISTSAEAKTSNSSSRMFSPPERPITSSTSSFRSVTYFTWCPQMRFAISIR